jgi:hypothetical protein
MPMCDIGDKQRDLQLSSRERASGQVGSNNNNNCLCMELYHSHTESVVVVGVDDDNMISHT